MAFDPFLYVAFLIGLAAGRLVHRRTRWFPRALILTVIVLVGLLGASLNDASPGALAVMIPVALGFAGLVLAVTAAIALLLARLRPSPPAAATGAEPTERFPLSLILVGAVCTGYGVGHVVLLPTGTAIEWALYVLLALVAFDLPLMWSGLRSVWVPLTAAVVGALAAGAVFAAVSGVALPVAMATTLAFGWYTLAGPLVLARAGALLGLLAFLTNFLRENLTMVLSPVLGRRLRGEGLAALGGATSMDTTLYFVTRYGDRNAGSLSLASGLILTVAASLILPFVLAFPV
ncbi:MAG TPA: LysO family transporter [Thermoplasmata archaeon]|nr:LysO family transporter [Thermoplasmata archaeon]